MDRSTTETTSLFYREPGEPMRGISLGRMFGVQIHLDWSLLIIFALILFNLGAGVFPRWHPEWSGVVTWVVALSATVLFFASLLAHELSHAIVARRYGIPVNRITLFLFGGLAHLEAEPPSPKSEFWMAIVGPITSVVIGLLATLAGSWLAHRNVPAELLADPEATVRSIGPLATLLLWLGPINILIGIFNVIPGFPLDGGRVLRAIFWGTTGDLVKATRWAARGGQLVAWTLMALGVMSIFTGGLVQGLWLLLIGWFLNNAARLSYRQLVVRRALEQVPVSRVMRTKIDRVGPDITVEELVRDHFMAHDQHALPVERDGHLVGLVCFDDVRKAPHDRWSEVTVSAIMTPASELATLPPDAPADAALEVLARRSVDQIPVLERDHVLGLVQRHDLVRWIALQGGEGAR
jgi:Zn-dependent protease/predicted transcriptional regulator